MALEAADVRARPARSGVRRKKGAIIVAGAATLAADGSVWFADATPLREFPPLRSAWARRGEQAVVTISGRKARRVVHGVLNIVTGEQRRVVRERNRGAERAALVAALALHTAAGRTLLIWENAPPHPTRVARATAEATGMTILPLPFRSPQLNPCEAVWREMKRVVAANRAYLDVDELAARAVTWLDDHTPTDLLRIAGRQSSKFDWLPT